MEKGSCVNKAFEPDENLLKDKKKKEQETIEISVIVSLDDLRRQQRNSESTLTPIEPDIDIQAISPGEEEDKRGGWNNKLDFLFSCISVSVGQF